MINFKKHILFFTEKSIVSGHSVDFMLRDDVLLHLKVVNDPPRLKINDRQGGKWGKEIRLPLIGPLDAEGFQIELRQDAQGVSLLAGGETARFERCGDLTRADKVRIPRSIQHAMEATETLPADTELAPAGGSAPAAGGAAVVSNTTGAAYQRVDAQEAAAGEASGPPREWRRFVFSRKAITQGHSVNFPRGDDIALHLKFNAAAGRLTINDNVRGSWRSEIRLPVPGLDMANSVEVHLVNGEDHVEISVSGGEKVIFSRCGRLESLDTARFSSNIYMVQQDGIDLGSTAAAADAGPAHTPLVPNAAPLPEQKFPQLLKDATTQWNAFLRETEGLSTALQQKLTLPPVASPLAKAGERAHLRHLDQRMRDMRALHKEIRQYIAQSEDQLRGVISAKLDFLGKLQDSAVEAAREDYKNALQARRQKAAQTAATRQAARLATRLKALPKERSALWVLRQGGANLPAAPAETPESEARKAVAALFDAAHYRGHFTEALPQDADLLAHYLAFGWQAGLDPHPLFSVAYYQAAYPEAAGLEPFGHFLLEGEAKGNSPHPLLSLPWLAAQAGGAPLAGLFAAFLAGKTGEASPHPAFDAPGYARRAKLEQGSAHAALLHYATEGWRKGLSPSAIFDIDHYLSQLDQEGTQGTEPYLHFLLYGAAEGIAPHALFDVRYYRQQAQAQGAIPLDALQHYLVEGEAAGLRPNPLFDPAFYRAQFAEAEAPAAGKALLHYIILGDKGVQSTHWLFSAKFAMAQLLPVRVTAGQTPLAFYLEQGLNAFTSPSPFYEVGHYLLAVGTALRGQHPVLHFLAAKPESFINPHPLFDAAFYRGQHEGTAFVHENPLADFILGVPSAFVFSPHPLFDSRYYMEKHSDVARLKLNPLSHYLLYGGKEGRNPSATFNTKFYQSKHNISNAINPLVHYALFGQDLGLPTLPQNEPAPAAAPAAPARPKVSYHRGRRPWIDGGKTILVVAHIAGKFLFGSERSFLDILTGFTTMNVNVIAVLPQNNPVYTQAVAELTHEVAICSYGWWRANPVSEEHVALFEQIIAEKKIDAVHANTIMLREPLIAANNKKIASVVHIRELIEKDEALIKLIGETPAQIIQKVRSNASWLISNSRATAQSFAVEGRSFVVPNTMDMTIMDMANEVEGEIVKFGLISSNLPKKGVLDFVELAGAAQHVAPNARFVLIGPETPLTAELQADQKAGKISPHVIFAGYAESPRAAIEQVNVVINFSHFAESFGRTVLEAMSARRPVIAYDWGALPELVSDGKTGFLIPFLKPLDALPAVIRLCSEKGLVQSLGEAARAIAVQDYSTIQYAAKLSAAYRTILGLQEPRPATEAQDVHPMLAASRASATKPEVIKRARGIDFDRKPGERPRIAYFCWHFPVPSETFVLNELRYLVSQGYDVRVFCRQTPYKDFVPDFPIQWQRVASPDDLAEALVKTGRTVAHGHFVYPTVTDFLWPACEKANIPFTFIAHAQDIFRYDNDAKNRVGEIGRAPLCRRVFVLSEFHRNFLIERGVPASKVVINPNAIDAEYFSQASIPDRSARKFRSICAVHRFAPKKGLDLLIRAAALLRDDGITIDLYGYGDLEESYRKLIEELQLTNVHIKGRTSNREGLLEVLRSYDLFACPSVRIENGDMDGIPTSVAEAMAAGMPVITTNISGIPSLVVDEITGIMVEPTPESIADGIRRYYAMPATRVDSMIEAARRRVREQHDVTRLCRVLLRTWNNETVDLLLVTWKNIEEHREVLRRLYKYTALPFHVIVCANYDEDPEVVELLESYHAQHDNFTLIYKGYNSFVGPGTNTAMDAGNSDVAIYVCGKEGMVLRSGWELSFIHHFAENADVGLAGTLCHSPTYMTGAEYPKGVREFARFRNQDFAAANPTRLFYHTQGGFFGIRRRMYDEIGGFSEAVPHDYTDVEYNYYAESRGWRLGEVPGLMALFNKSRPPLIARFDETIGATHPPALSELEVFDAIASGRRFNCNVCGWNGEAFERVGQEAHCPSCHSTRADRSLMRWMAPSVLLHRRLPALCVGLTGKMQAVWAEQFQGPRLSWEEFLDTLQRNKKLPNRPASLHIIGLRGLPENPETLGLVLAEAWRLMVPEGTLLVQPAEGENPLRLQGAPPEFEASMAAAGFVLRETPVYFSRSSQLDWAPMWVLRKTAITQAAAAE
ncbi:glycosyltransferase [Roseomonas sp. GC11]|uniref:glycosyltransferase n=1 Tax=Roseomonas sp. GC11 TaxID=2950546 RepID=UPI00210B5565|nr:glycosyltransferase [Roseomonas sp. GC11]MCQ4162166.1 glycosyltransferase [Roseomonas sp. GC11]